MAQRFVTMEIPASQLRPGDVVTEEQSNRADKHTVVKTITRYSKHATMTSKTHHQGCRGVHVNGSNCWDAALPLRVTRENGR